ELQRLQNKIAEEKLVYLKDMERKLRQLTVEWRKAEDKHEVMKMVHQLLFKQKEKQVTEKVQKKVNSKYEETGQAISTGIKARMKKSHQVGIVKEIRGKKAILQVGVIPITVDLENLIAVKEKVQPETEK
ncbi:MAG TPA: DNA mismatch repair protein MutS, partial [Parasegetibacter sp.]